MSTNPPVLTVTPGSTSAIFNWDNNAYHTLDTAVLYITDNTTNVQQMIRLTEHQALNEEYVVIGLTAYDNYSAVYVQQPGISPQISMTSNTVSFICENNPSAPIINSVSFASAVNYSTNAFTLNITVPSLPSNSTGYTYIRTNVSQEAFGTNPSTMYTVNTQWSGNPNPTSPVTISIVINSANLGASLILDASYVFASQMCIQNQQALLLSDLSNSMAQDANNTLAAPVISLLSSMTTDNRMAFSVTSNVNLISRLILSWTAGATVGTATYLNPEFVNGVYNGFINHGSLAYESVVNATAYLVTSNGSLSKTSKLSNAAVLLGDTTNTVQSITIGAAAADGTVSVSSTASNPINPSPAVGSSQYNAHTLVKNGSVIGSQNGGGIVTFPSISVNPGDTLSTLVSVKYVVGYSVAQVFNLTAPIKLEAASPSTFRVNCSTTTATTTNNVVPISPTNLNALAYQIGSSPHIQLTWQEGANIPNNASTTSYTANLYANIGASTALQTIIVSGAPYNPLEECNFDYAGLTPSHIYFCGVVATNSVGSSPESTRLSIEYNNGLPVINNLTATSVKQNNNAYNFVFAWTPAVVSTAYTTPYYRLSSVDASGQFTVVQSNISILSNTCTISVNATDTLNQYNYQMQVVGTDSYMTVQYGAYSNICNVTITSLPSFVTAPTFYTDLSGNSWMNMKCDMNNGTITTTPVMVFIPQDVSALPQYSPVFFINLNSYTAVNGVYNLVKVPVGNPNTYKINSSDVWLVTLTNSVGTVYLETGLSSPINDETVGLPVIPGLPVFPGGLGGLGGL
jgi:hypothetical protein